MNPERQQNEYTLQFAYYLAKNFVFVYPDKYYRRNCKENIPANFEDGITAHKCLEEFEQQYIPPLPDLPIPQPSDGLVLLEEYARIHKIFVNGYTKMLSVLYSDTPLQKQHLMEIIRDTMANVNADR